MIVFRFYAKEALNHVVTCLSGFNVRIIYALCKKHTCTLLSLGTRTCPLSSFIESGWFLCFQSYSHFNFTSASKVLINSTNCLQFIHLPSLFFKVEVIHKM